VARHADRALTARAGAPEATSKNGLGSDPRVGLEAFDHLAWDRVAEHPLDVAEQPRLVDAHERDGVAIDPCAPRPTDPVDVVLGNHRELEVDDMRQRVDVESARGDLGRDEHREAAGLEVGQRANALWLALVAVDGRRLDPVVLELRGEAVGTVLRAREHERLVDLAAADEVAEQLALALAIDRVATCVTRSVALLRGATWTNAGSCNRPSARRRISFEKVAEKSRFWRRGGNTARILRMSRMKPMSSIRSASSRTRISTRDRSTVLWPR
jgi:hypothetical protein